MDALTHNVESYLSPDYHPLCDGIALVGVRIAARRYARCEKYAPTAATTVSMSSRDTSQCVTKRDA